MPGVVLIHVEVHRLSAWASENCISDLHIHETVNSPGVRLTPVEWWAGKDCGRIGTVEQPYVLAYVSDRTLTTLCQLGHL